MQYSDFILRIESISSRQGKAAVVASPAGEGETTFNVPHLLETSRRRLCGLWRDLVRAEHSYPEWKSIKDFGAHLYGAVFGGSLGPLLESSLSEIARHAEEGLRIKIQIDPSASRLHSLPWESLYDSRRDSFLAINKFTPVVRYWSRDNPKRMQSIDNNLRILVVAASPCDMPQLDLETEIANIQQAVAGVPGIELSILSHATLHGLAHALQQEDFHIIHYTGAATMSGESGEGSLLLEDENGTAMPVRASMLASLMESQGSARLVFLNACDTARSANTEKINPFRNLASSLMFCGAPAVIGMQFPISDSAAIAFSSIFYRKLAAGETLESALTEGRQFTLMKESTTTEWVTPVLFTSLPDGELFAPSSRRNLNPYDRVRIFLCHSSGDKPKVRDLYKRLVLHGFDVWLDEVNILPGQRWKDEINAALRRSHVVLVCLSRDSLAKTGYIQRELGVALDLLSEQPQEAIFLIPVRLEDCAIPERLQDIQYVDLFTPTGYAKLIRALEVRADNLGITRK